MYVPHSPHCGQRPSSLGAFAPQFWHIYIVEDFTFSFYKDKKE